MPPVASHRQSRLVVPFDTVERFTHVPLVANITHQECAIEFRRAAWKALLIVEEARLCPGYIKWLNPPVLAPEFQTIKNSCRPGHRIPARATLEERGSLF